ncbi:hypothetical protein [Streptomyces sp. NPDC002644]
MADNFTFRKGWEYDAFKTLETGALVAESCEKIRALVVQGAPRARNAKNGGATNWNQIKAKGNIAAFVDRDHKGYWGNVTIEPNRRVSHTLLQDRGWTDKKGRKHPGKRFVKEALWKSRED